MKMKQLFTSILIIPAILFLTIATGLNATTPDDALVKKAAEIHDKVLTVDTHTDTPMRLMRSDFDIGQMHEKGKRGNGRVDFPRMKKGGLDAIFLAVFLGQGPLTDEGHEKARKKAVEIFGRIHEETKKNADKAELALTARDAYRIEKTGKRAVYIGIENGYPIGKDIKLVKKFYDMGARYITLCHNKHNEICDSSTDDNKSHNGLSPFGKKVVKEMNRLGMIVDISHVSDKSFYDVLETSQAPVMASHSCVRALCDHPRNMTDDMIKALAKKGGVVQVCFVSSFLKKLPPNPERDAAFKVLREKYKNYDTLPPEQQKKAGEEWEAIMEKFPRDLASVSDIVNHIDHIVKVAGIDHVGIGTDFDGGGGVNDCYDVSELGNITLELVKRGYTEPQIRKLWGGNFMRVFKGVEKTAMALSQKK